MIDPSSAAQVPTTAYLIGRVDRIVRRALEERIQDQNVSVFGYTAMSVLEARPGLSNAELARRSMVTPQGMNQIVASLSALGMIRRRPDPRNRRVQLLELTDDGHRVVAACNRRVEAVERELLACLSPAQRGELKSILLTIVNVQRHS